MEHVTCVNDTPNMVINETLYVTVDTVWDGINVECTKEGYKYNTGNLDKPNSQEPDSSCVALQLGKTLTIKNSVLTGINKARFLHMEGGSTIIMKNVIARNWGANEGGSDSYKGGLYNIL